MLRSDVEKLREVKLGFDEAGGWPSWCPFVYLWWPNHSLPFRHYVSQLARC